MAPVSGAWSIEHCRTKECISFSLQKESMSVLLGVRAVCEIDMSEARMGIGVMMDRSCAMMVQYPREITTSTGVPESSARVSTVE